MKRTLYMLFAVLLAGAVMAQEAKNELDSREDAKTRSNTTSEQKAKEVYKFSVSYRLQVGYTQDWQFQQKDTATNIYLHGVNLGVTFDFNLPYRFSIQTGAIYTMTTSHHAQQYAAVKPAVHEKQVMDSWIYKHSLIVPVYLFYRQPLWKDLALVFYTGPAFNIGLYQQNKLTPSMHQSTLDWLETSGQPIESYNRYDTDLQRFNMQYGLGGGLEWANYRVQAGYSFGLNDINKRYLNKAYEWGWHISFVYKVKSEK